MADTTDTDTDWEIEPPELHEGEIDASTEEKPVSNKLIRQMMERNYLDYAAYVIKERAIPDVDDGLKPVQRRILWSMHSIDDGKFHKVANIIGQTMQYHPHGDASIGGALVVLANKEYFIDRQGNFGNIYTGDNAASPRYIEARLSPLGREVLFNDDLTNFIETYDGRKKEPIVLPVKIPALLLLGSKGIAVGMSTNIMPHNFKELLQAQIAELKGEKYQLYPDFQQGGMMEVAEYDSGNGKIKLRARIDIEGRRLIVREIPALTTSEQLIASIEREVEKNRLKIASINDFTGEKIEIEIIPSRGQDPKIIMQALYAYTDCSISASLKMLVICENRPVVMDVQSVIKRNSAKLIEYLQLELENELNRLLEEIHRKTLAQIFIENRIYKDIEQCKNMETINRAVFDGVMKFRDQLQRDVSDEDIVMLLAIPIRRISLFDINKNEKETAEIHKRIKEVKDHLKKLTEYAIAYLQALLDKYGKDFPRRTEIVDEFDKIDVQDIALKNIRVGWDRKNGYLGTNVKSDDFVQCNEFDKLLCIEREGDYKIINIPDKAYGGKLYEMRRHDPKTEFGVVYRDKTSGKSYGKRCFIEQFITDKVYRLCPENCRLELLTSRSDAIYELVVKLRNSTETSQLNLQELPVRSPRARGKLLDSKAFRKITWVRYLTEEENFALNQDYISESDSETEISDEENVKTAECAMPPQKKSEKKEQPKTQKTVTEKKPSKKEETGTGVKKDDVKKDDVKKNDVKKDDVKKDDVKKDDVKKDDVKKDDVKKDDAKSTETKSTDVKSTDTKNADSDDKNTEKKNADSDDDKKKNDDDKGGNDKNGSDGGSSSGSSSGTAKKRKKDDDGESWGIVQPTFGF